MQSPDMAAAIGIDRSALSPMGTPSSVITLRRRFRQVWFALPPRLEVASTPGISMRCDLQRCLSVGRDRYRGAQAEGIGVTFMRLAHGLLYRGVRTISRGVPEAERHYASVFSIPLYSP